MPVMERLKKINIETMLFVIVVTLMFFLPFERTLEPEIHIVGKLATLGIFAVTSLYILYLLLMPNTITDKRKKYIWFYIGTAISLSVLSFLRGGILSVKAAILMALMLNVAIAMAHIDYRKIADRIYLIDIGILTYIVIMIGYYMTIEKPRSYLFLYNNPNYLGLVCSLLIFLCLMAYGMTQEARYLIYLMPLVIVVYLSNSRTSLIALTIAFIVYVLWEVISKNKALYYGFFALLISGIVIVTMGYPIVNSLAESKNWDQEKVQKISKKLYNGRETVWLKSIDHFKEKPVIGYGVGTTLESLTPEDEKQLSAHNIYVQLLLENGIIGLLVFVGLLGWIWKSLYKAAKEPLTRAGASALIGILVIGTFELTLLWQSISLGIFQWFMIGAGLSLALYKKEGSTLRE